MADLGKISGAAEVKKEVPGDLLGRLDDLIVGVKILEETNLMLEAENDALLAALRSANSVISDMLVSLERLRDCGIAGQEKIRKAGKVIRPKYAEETTMGYVTFIVNGKSISMAPCELYFSQIVGLAFQGQFVGDPIDSYTVTLRDRAGKTLTMGPGQWVKITDGMVFNVARTGDA